MLTTELSAPTRQITPAKGLCHPHPDPVFPVPERIRRRWNQFTVRDATPEDTPFLAWALQESARSHGKEGLWDFVIPGCENQRLRILGELLTLGEHHFCHYSGFLIAEKDGRPVACVSSYDPTKDSPEDFSALLLRYLQSEGWDDNRVFQLVLRAAPFLKCLPAADPETLVAEWAATVAEMRLHGLMFLLVEHMVHKAKQLNYSWYQVSHYKGNTAVIRSLVKAGFIFRDSVRSSRLQGLVKFAGMDRYTLRLNRD